MAGKKEELEESWRDLRKLDKAKFEKRERECRSGKGKSEEVCTVSGRFGAIRSDSERVAAGCERDGISLECWPLARTGIGMKRGQ